MKNIKELFNNIKTKIKESKIASFVNNVTSKITNNKIVNSAKTRFSNIKAYAKDFGNNHQNIKDSMAGDVTNRFSSKFKKFFKNITKNIQDKANNGNMFAKIVTVVIKVLSIIAAIAFAALVIYYIKDVFMYCLTLVAMCAATALCIEFILSILSVATGCKI